MSGQEENKYECRILKINCCQIKEEKTADKFEPVVKPEKFICRGAYLKLVHLCAEAGYLIWIEPEAALRVLFTYGDTNCDFLVYLEPEVPGVAINYMEPEKLKYVYNLKNNEEFRPIQIHSGLAASHLGASGTRHSYLGSVLNQFSYAIDSVNGKCLIELRVLNNKQLSELIQPIVRPFKLNFRLVL